MIIKGAQILPHALINNVKTKLGEHGELLEQYVAWLRDRVLQLRTDENYNPIFHIDVYGTIGAAFGNDNYKAMADYMARLEEAAKPFHLRIEGPMDVEDREKQMRALAAITKELDDRGINVEIVADEWCNTLEDIKYFADNKAGHMVQIKTHDRGCSLLQRKGHRRIPGQHLQRNRPFRTGLHPVRNGNPARSDPCKTRHGR